MSPLLGLVTSLYLLGSSVGLNAADHKQPILLRTPDGGIQPQAVIDSLGVLHLIYLKGDPGASDVYYVRRQPGAKTFSEPIRVNSQAGSAIAIGTIRGAHFALGKNGRVQVAWNGNSKSEPKAPNNGVPMLYARLADSGKAFEEQRNLMQRTFMLDGGGSVAADDLGNVYVAWHARKLGDTEGEEHRKVWLARSTDDGKTFAEEEVASPEPTGACGCCGMRAFVDPKGALHMLYRSAKGTVNRDMYLLTSTDQGKRFESARLHPWKIATCPMSSETFAAAADRVVAGWETDSQIYFATIPLGSANASSPQQVPGHVKNRKHPAVAVAPSGDSMVAWAEGTGWNKSGSLAWQGYDAAGKPNDIMGRVDGGIPLWSLPTVVADRDGQFFIIH